MDKAQSHGFILFARESALYTGFKHLAAVDDGPDIWNGTERGIFSKGAPIAVKGDKAGLVLWHIFVKHLLHGQRQSLEHFPFFNGSHTLESIYIVRVYGEEPDKFVHALVHAVIVFGKRFQVVTNP